MLLLWLSSAIPDVTSVPSQFLDASTLYRRQKDVIPRNSLDLPCNWRSDGSQHHLASKETLQRYDVSLTIGQFLNRGNSILPWLPAEDLQNVNETPNV
jgi:hypothetical protein